MTAYLAEFIGELWAVLLELSPALLLGLALAGLLHAFLPSGLIKRHLSASTAGSVMRAVMIGVPMPLCSCGVVPTTLGLRRDGASRGASTGFLISTPQTGVDSILVSATFLGWPFAVFKVAAAFLTGMLGGVLVNATEPKGFAAQVEASATQGTTSALSDESGASIPAKVLDSLRYALFELLGAINTYLIIGVVLAALLGVLLPDGYFNDIGWVQGIGGMLLVLLIATPLYVCTTSSVPIAASLVAAGMPVGTALVFLMAGPATNITTLALIWRALGKRVTLIYLGVVLVMSVVLGLTFEALFTLKTPAEALSAHQHHSIVNIMSAYALIAMSGYLILSRFIAKHILKKELNMSDKDLVLNVGGMNCGHCTATVKRTLEAQPNVTEAIPDLDSGKVVVKGDDLDQALLAEKIREVGYTCETA